MLRNIVLLYHLAAAWYYSVLVRSAQQDLEWAVADQDFAPTRLELMRKDVLTIAAKGVRHLDAIKQKGTPK